MPSRLWSLPDLPEDRPVPVRLEALGADLYLEAGSLVTPALKSALAAQGIAGFREAEPAAPGTTPSQEWFQAPPKPVVMPEEAAIAPLLRDALQPQVPPRGADQTAHGFLLHLYRRPFEPLDLTFLDSLAADLVAWAAHLPGPPVLAPHAQRPDSWLAEHVLDSARWAVWFAADLDLPEADLQSLVRAALLRDIGQLAVAPEVLYAGRALDQQSKSQIADHPLHSAAWLSSRGVVAEEVHRVVRQHHERFDGTGYPLGLPGSTLAKAAQILALCDTFMAVASPRPHRQARTLHAASQAVLEGAGTRFDPGLARHFIQRVGLYPAGSVIEVDQQFAALVTDGNGPHRWRPKARLLRREGNRWQIGPEVDLARHPAQISGVRR